MSDVLANAALTGDIAANGVPDAPDVVAGEVVENSTGVPAGYIEKARFDGLMGTMNREKYRADREAEAKAAAEARLVQLEEELNSLRNGKAPEQEIQNEVSTTDTSNDVQVMRQQLDALTELLVTERLNNAREAVIAQNPELRPLAKFLQADTPEDLFALGGAISEALKGGATPSEVQEAVEGAQGQTTATESNGAVPVSAETTPSLQATPVVAGGTSFDSSASLQSQIDKAIDDGNWSKAIELKQELAGFDLESVE